VFRVTDITVPAFDAASPEGKRIDDDAPLADRGLLAQYVSRLQTDLGATINMEALRRVVVGQQRPELMQIEPPPRRSRRAMRAASRRWCGPRWSPISKRRSRRFSSRGGTPLSFLFESVEGGAVRGRYSIIGLEPDLIWRTHGTRRDQPRGAQQTRCFAPCPERRSPRCAR
jgi:hypothetical protein